MALFIDQSLLNKSTFGGTKMTLDEFLVRERERLENFRTEYNIGIDEDPAAFASEQEAYEWEDEYEAWKELDEDPLLVDEEEMDGVKFVPE